MTVWGAIGVELFSSKVMGATRGCGANCVVRQANGMSTVVGGGAIMNLRLSVRTLSRCSFALHVAVLAVVHTVVPLARADPFSFQVIGEFFPRHMSPDGSKLWGGLQVWTTSDGVYVPVSPDGYAGKILDGYSDTSDVDNQFVYAPYHLQIGDREVNVGVARYGSGDQWSETVSRWYHHTWGQNTPPQPFEAVPFDTAGLLFATNDGETILGSVNGVLTYWSSESGVISFPNTYFTSDDNSGGAVVSPNGTVFPIHDSQRQGLWIVGEGFQTASFDFDAVSDTAVGIADSQIWSAATNQLSIIDVLTSHGVSVPFEQWGFEALEISADGKTIAGLASQEFGPRLAWVAHIPKLEVLSDSHWDGPLDGSFSESSNWLEGYTPWSQGTVHFDTIGSSALNLGQDEVCKAVRVNAGNVKVNLNGHTLVAGRGDPLEGSAVLVAPGGVLQVAGTDTALSIAAGGVDLVVGGPGASNIGQNASLLVASGALLDQRGMSAHASIGGSGGTGIASIDGPGSKWLIGQNFSGDLAIGVGGKGSLRITNGAYVQNSGTAVIGNGTPTNQSPLPTRGPGEVLVDGVGSVWRSGDSEVDSGPVLAGAIEMGEHRTGLSKPSLIVRNGGVVETFRLRARDQASIQLADGTLAVDMLELTEGATLRGFGHVFGNVYSASSIIGGDNGETLELHGHVTTTHNSGDASPSFGGAVRFSGEFEPGGPFSAAAVPMGSIELVSTSFLSISVSGTQPGQFDRLIGTGTATLGGTLRVAFNGFWPVAGDNSSFNILDFESLSGRFQRYDLPDLESMPWHYWSTAAINTAGTLSLLFVPPKSDDVEVLPTQESFEFLNGPGSERGGQVTFTEVGMPGTLSVEQIVVPADAELTNYELAPLTFRTAGNAMQVWQFEFDGTYYGPIALTLHYLDTLLSDGVDENSLDVFHFENGEWRALPVVDRDSLNNTITVTTHSFSPFALGMHPVPEPAGWLLLAMGAGIALATRRVARVHPIRGPRW